MKAHKKHALDHWGHWGEDEKFRGRKDEKSGSIMPSRMKSDSTWIGLDSGRSPRCVMGSYKGLGVDARGTDRYREGCQAIKCTL